jgi:hypothetical protein
MPRSRSRSSGSPRTVSTRRCRRLPPPVGSTGSRTGPTRTGGQLVVVEADEELGDVLSSGRQLAGMGWHRTSTPSVTLTRLGRNAAVRPFSDPRSGAADDASIAAYAAATSASGSSRSSALSGRMVPSSSQIAGAECSQGRTRHPMTPRRGRARGFLSARSETKQ